MAVCIGWEGSWKLTWLEEYDKENSIIRKMKTSLRFMRWLILSLSLIPVACEVFLNQCHRCNQSHVSDNTRSLTCWDTRELQIKLLNKNPWIVYGWILCYPKIYLNSFHSNHTSFLMASSICQEWLCPRPLSWLLYLLKNSDPDTYMAFPCLLQVLLSIHCHNKANTKHS